MTAVSVVMPVRNGAPFVKQAIDSILSQSYSDFQFIIINDHSTDDTWSILKNYRDKRIIRLNNTNSGLVNSLNIGLEAAVGEFIMRMDADDVAKPERMQAQIDFLKTNPEIGLVSCMVEPLTGNANNEGYAHHVAAINQLITPEDHYLNRFVDAPVAHPSVMFRQSLLSQHGGYSDFPGPEDYELWLRWLAAGVSMAKVPQILLKWTDSPDRLSRTAPDYDKEHFFDLKARYFANWKLQRKLAKPIWIWGYSKIVFKRVARLVHYGITIAGYLDIKERPNATRQVLLFSDYKKSMGFVLVYVNDRTGKAEIQAFFDRNGAKAGIDYYFMA